jgi:hypothetical protein
MKASKDRAGRDRVKGSPGAVSRILVGSAMTVPRGPSVTPEPREKPQVRPTLQPAFTMASRRAWISGRALASRDLSMRSHVLTPTYAALQDFNVTYVVSTKSWVWAGRTAWQHALHNV